MDLLTFGVTPNDVTSFLLKLKSRGNLEKDTELMHNVIMLRPDCDFVKCIDFIEARSNLDSDYENVENLLKAGLPVDNLKDCSDFMVPRGQRPEDLVIIIKLSQAKILNHQFKNVL